MQQPLGRETQFLGIHRSHFTVEWQTAEVIITIKNACQQVSWERSEASSRAAFCSIIAAVLHNYKTIYVLLYNDEAYREQILLLATCCRPNTGKLTLLRRFQTAHVDAHVDAHAGTRDKARLCSRIHHIYNQSGIHTTHF
jgi:hypothetical protein